MKVRYVFTNFLAAALVALSACGVAKASFTDPSFEAPLTYDGAPFVGSWEGFSGNFGGGLASSTQVAAMPRTGAGSVELTITSAAGFAGLFQDIAGLTPGQEVTYTGWQKLGNTASLIGPEVRIEWRTADNSAPEVSRTPNLVLPLTTEYSQFSLTAVVPAGATVARAVYAAQTFGGGLTGGTIFIDDFGFTTVPEPSAVLLAGVALLGAAFRRR